VIAVIGSVPNGPVAGDPEVAVPVGYSATQRRNTAVDVNGGAYDDYNLIGVSYVIEQGIHGREPAADVNPSAYRCAHTSSNVTPEPFAERGHCNPDYVSLMKMLGGTPKVLPFSLETTSATELETKLEEGTLTSEELVKAELYRAALTNDDGPSVQALRAVAPGAITAAIESDKRRRKGRSKGVLDGVPVVVDDSIDVKGLATSAGSIALQDHLPAANATLVKNLEEQGSIILGDTNIGEFGGAMEGANMPPGYSSLGGQVLLPADTNKSPGGSSAGSVAAVSMGLSPLAVGIETSTETGAQMITPASNAGLVALKPTVGLVSTEGVLPVAKSQDAPGPIAQTVKDAATELELLTGETGLAGKYTAGLKTTALGGKNIAVLATAVPASRTVGEQVYVAAENQLNNLGATYTKVTPEAGTTAPSVIPYELKTGLNAYLEKATTGPKSLAEVIAYNEANKVEGLKFGEAGLTAAQAIKTGEAEAKTPYEENLAKGRTQDQEVIDKILASGGGYQAIMVPITETKATEASKLLGIADRAGYPVLTLPAGYGLQNSGTGGDPIGVDLIGTKGSEAELLADAYALEQGLKARQLGPEYMRATNPSVSGAPSETNQSMFRCVAGSAFYKPYDCNPGEVGFNALKIAGEGKLETPGAPESVGAPETVGTGGSSETTTTPPSSSSPTPKVELVGKAKLTGTGKASIKIHVSGPGKVTVTGPDIKAVTIKVKKAGTVTVPITLKPAPKRSLAAKGKLKMTVKVAFVATDGTKTTKALRLTLVPKH
jgi:Asp-tRNA(Asn)/Glu-tRNA(Gln) amidotransferase A subunit family amidase